MSLIAWVPRVIWQRRGVAGRLGYAALRPMSGLFGAVVALRGLAYRAGLLSIQRAPVPVVSVGNLVVGGTGKTPFTIWLAQTLRGRDLRPGILLRGYGGRSTGVHVVSRGAGPEAAPEEVGDEAVMIARSFAGPVVAAASRIAGAQALAELGCDVVLLDDGFQHRAIHRMYDIVLFDGRAGALLPAGPMRERVSALRRADAVVLAEQGESADRVPKPSLLPHQLLCRSHPEATALIETVDRSWREKPLGALVGKHVVAVVGIARPERFYELLRQSGAEIDEVFEFGDHHRYTAADWQRIARRGHSSDLVVTTEKDLVKLEAFPFATGKLVALRIAPRVDPSEALVGAILARVRDQSHVS